MKKLFYIIFAITVLFSKSSKINYDEIFSKFYYSTNKEKMKYIKILGDGARSNNPKALYYSGLIFDKIFPKATSKKMVKFLYKKSIKEYQKRNDKNIVYPLYALGTLLMEEKKYKEGIKLLNQCSNLNYYKATMYLIRFYEIEYFNNPKSMTKMKLKKIIKLYQKLLQSKKYRSKALTGLGRWYIIAPFEEFRNYDLALKYSLEAANDYQEIDAYDNLVTLYGYRDTKYKDMNKSYYWEALSHIEYLTRLKDGIEGIMSMPNWKKTEKTVPGDNNNSF